MGVAGRLLYRTVERGERSMALIEESVSIGRQMLEKQDQMLQKQDETTGEIRALRGDLKSFMVVDKSATRQGVTD
jgi:hypothetical protein